MKVLITGGGGFVGSHAAEFYAQRNEEVIVFDNLSRADILGKSINTRYNWDHLKKYDNIEFVKGDIRNFTDIKEVADVDVIIHTAAQVAITTSLTDPRTDFEINALGTFNVLEAARKSKSSPAVIFCSTNKVFGDNVNKIPVVEKEKRYEFSDARFKNGIPESFPIDLCEHTPYGVSKLAADIYVQDYAHRNEVDAAVFRMSCTYGTRQFGVEDQGWVAWFTIATVLNKPITIFGDGKQVRDVLFVSDLIKAFDLFIKKRDELHLGVYNIGGGVKNTLSLLELLEIVEDETKKKPAVSFSDWRHSDQKVYISDIRKAKKELNWEPEIGCRQGIKMLLQWITENKDKLGV
jgi:CDP-paratose 2-epimerase